MPNPPHGEPVSSTDHGEPLRPVIFVVDEVQEFMPGVGPVVIDADVAALAALIRARTAELAAAARRCSCPSCGVTPPADSDSTRTEDRRG